jgi:hypothetical protein
MPKDELESGPIHQKCYGATTLANPPKLTKSLHFRDTWQIGKGVCSLVIHNCDEDRRSSPSSAGGGRDLRGRVGARLCICTVCLP